MSTRTPNLLKTHSNDFYFYSAKWPLSLQNSKLLTTSAPSLRTSSPDPFTPSRSSPTDERASPVPMASSLVLVIASTKARLIEDFPPTWYNNACGSSTIIENAPWESVVHASPTTHKDLNQALPVNALSKLFAATVKDGHESGEYTKTRATILMALGQYFCSAVYSSAAIAGSMLSTAVQVGHRRALDIVLAAVQHIPLLEGAATLARRASVQGHTEDVLTEFVAALDGNLIPNESDQYLKWHSLVPAPGESSRQFLTRLITAAATISKTEEDIVNQFRMGIDQSVKTGSSVAQSVRSDTRACKTLSELNKERASNRSLYDGVLIATPRRAPLSPVRTLTLRGAWPAVERSPTLPAQNPSASARGRCPRAWTRVSRPSKSRLRPRSQRRAHVSVRHWSVVCSRLP